MSTDNSVWQIQQPFHNYAGMPCTRSLQKSKTFTGRPHDGAVSHAKHPAPLLSYSSTTAVPSRSNTCLLSVQSGISLPYFWCYQAQPQHFRDCLTASVGKNPGSRKKSKALLIQGLIFSVFKGTQLLEKLLYLIKTSSVYTLPLYKIASVKVNDYTLSMTEVKIQVKLECPFFPILLPQLKRVTGQIINCQQDTPARKFLRFPVYKAHWKYIVEGLISVWHHPLGFQLLFLSPITSIP